MKIWIATGGTGGHVYPALSVADELIARGHSVIISRDGRVRKMVADGAPRGAKIAAVWAAGVGAKSKLNQIIALFKIAVSAAWLTLRFAFTRPARVVAFGGYASVPAVFAAHGITAAPRKAGSALMIQRRMQGKAAKPVPLIKRSTHLLGSPSMLSSPCIEFFVAGPVGPQLVYARRAGLSSHKTPKNAAFWRYAVKSG